MAEHVKIISTGVSHKIGHPRERPGNHMWLAWALTSSESISGQLSWSSYTDPTAERTWAHQTAFRATLSPPEDDCESMIGDTVIWVPYLTSIYQYMIQPCSLYLLNYRTCLYWQNWVLSQPEHPRARSWKHDVKWPSRSLTTYGHSSPWLRDLIRTKLVAKCTNACLSALQANPSKLEPRS